VSSLQPVLPDPNLDPMPTLMPDHIYDPARGVWLLGGLPIVDGVVDGQGCDMVIDLVSELHIFYLPSAAELASRAVAAAASLALSEPTPAEDADLAMLKTWAAKDPNAAALLRRVGLIP
jgi:hypothetical protein